MGGSWRATIFFIYKNVRLPKENVCLRRIKLPWAIPWATLGCPKLPDVSLATSRRFPGHSQPCWGIPVQPVSTKPDSPQFPWVTCAIRPSRHRRAESGRSPGALAKLGPLARGSSLTGALFRAPGKFDIRASEPSFVRAPGRPADSYKLQPLAISPGSFQALPDHAKYVQTAIM